MSLPGLSRRDRAELCCESGEHVLRRGDFGAARDSFLAAIRLFPSLSSAHLGLAKAERQLGRMKEAEQAARAALQADPRCGRAAHYLGSLMVEQGRLAEGLPLLSPERCGSQMWPNIIAIWRSRRCTLATSQVGARA